MEQPLVLVVEDDFLVRLNTVEIFEAAGFKVVEAGNVASALAVLKEKSAVRLVCTDVHMPGELDGIDLALHIQERHPKTKVIVISGDRRRRALPPAIPFLPKPFLSARLVDVAREQLGAAA
jgi:DNA-binding NtrC family response regulator